MPFGRKRSFSRRGGGSKYGKRQRGGSRFGSRAVRKLPLIKDVSSFYPPVAKCTATLNTGWIANGGDAGATYQQRINILLNGTYRPLFFTDPTITTDHQNVCPANLYADAIAPGAGLVGSRVTNAPYRQYRVEGVLVRIEIINNGDDPVQYIHYVPSWVSGLGGLPPVPPVANTISNLQKTHYECVVPSAGAQQKPVLFKRYYNCRRDLAQMTKAQWLGQDGESQVAWAVSMDGVGSSVYSLENPECMMYLVGMFYTMARGTGATGPPASSIYFRIQLKYYLTLFGRNDLASTNTVPSLQEGQDVTDTQEEKLMEDEEELKAEPVLVPAVMVRPGPPGPGAAASAVASLSRMSLGSPRKSEGVRAAFKPVRTRSKTLASAAAPP